MFTALLAALSSIIVTCLYPEQVDDMGRSIVKPFLHREALMRTKQVTKEVSVQSYRSFIDDVMFIDKTSDGDKAMIEDLTLDIFARDPNAFIAYASDHRIGRKSSV